MDIKIIVASHKRYWMPEDSCYLPVQVGREGKADIGYTPDNTGDNISARNANYCELTGLYWAWKNLKADYLGLVHYRRYFTKKEKHSVEAKKQEILTTADWQQLLRETPIVVPDKRNYYIENNRSHYNHAHPREGLDATETVLKEKYPEYMSDWETVMHRTWAHMFNMFVMRRDYYDAYCQWMFDILADLDQHVDISRWTPYDQRLHGFVSELLLDVWLEHNHLPYKEQNVSFMEKQNWIKKGGLFLKRKFIHQ